MGGPTLAQDLDSNGNLVDVKPATKSESSDSPDSSPKEPTPPGDGPPSMLQTDSSRLTCKSGRHKLHVLDSGGRKILDDKDIEQKNKKLKKKQPPKKKKKKKKKKS